MTENDMVVAIMVILGGVAAFGTIAWTYVQRLKLNRGGTPAQLDAIGERLARMENAIDAMSVEVERISEGQRFATKLLADRAESAEGASARGRHS